MSQVYEFRGAARYILGVGALSRLGEEAAAYGQNILLVADPVLAEVGVEDRVMDALTQSGASVTVYKDFYHEPEADQADEAAGLARKNDCQAVIGLGGGSAMDLAKAAAVLATNDGRAEEYIGVGLVPKPGLPTIMLPTTAGTGSEVTWTAVFTMRAKKAKGGINSPYLYPNLALLDPVLTMTTPPDITAQTGMDALCHAVESFTSVKANPISDLLAREAISLIGRYLPIAYADGRNMEARENMLRASLFAGMGLANAGVTAVHALSYPLGAVYGVPHGLANAMLLPYVMNFNCLGSPDKFAEIAVLLGEEVGSLSKREAAKLAGMVVMDLMSDLDFPESLEDLDIAQEDLPDLADKAMNLQRVLDNNPRMMDRDDALFIYEEAF
jgi:alcohol dehydrogenase